MRLPDENKRRELLAVAARLFAARPYHEVRLEEVVAAARVSKGTVYTYFEGKEDLFLSIVRDGAVELLARVRARCAADGGPVLDVLRDVVREIVAFCVDHAAVIRVMRQSGVAHGDARLRALGDDLRGTLEALIRDGVRRGEMVDPAPGLTPTLLLGAIVEPLVQPGPTPGAGALTAQVLHLFVDGLRGRGPPAARRRRRS